MVSEMSVLSHRLTAELLNPPTLNYTPATEETAFSMTEEEERELAELMEDD